MSVGAVVVLVLFAVVVLAAVALMVRMFVKNDPFWGAVALGVLVGPGTALSLAYLGVA
ncbi:MAG: hypothetical protein HOY78_18700 [Saccharothrix sp.]|nr:hypothetical protein [Saccharothrix sp.]